MKELQDAAASVAVLSRTERMVILSDIATDLQSPIKTRISAIDVLNKMDGDYVKKIEAVVNTDTEKVAAEIEAILDE